MKNDLVCEARRALGVVVGLGFDGSQPPRADSRALSESQLPYTYQDNMRCVLEVWTLRDGDAGCRDAKHKQRIKAGNGEQRRMNHGD